MNEEEREELRILRAVAERRMRVNEGGRYVIDGEARPKRQMRERMMCRGLISWRSLTLTKKGWERYDELLAQEAASEEGGGLVVSAPNTPERIDAPERQTLWVCPDCSSVADLVGHEPLPRLRCSHVGGEWEMVPVPYVRADRVTPEMIDRAARAIGLCRCEECMEYWRSVAEAALRAALGVEEPEAEDA